MAKAKRFESCATILKETLKKAEIRSGQRYPIDWLAEKSGIAQPTLNACKQGTRYLNDENVQNVAKCLGLSEEETVEFRTRTRAAKDAAEPEVSIRKILADPNASLRVEQLTYLPFSDKDKFVDRFLKRFFQLSGIATTAPPVESTFLEDRATRLLNRRSDLAVNLFCTLPRLKKLDFLLFPIRLSISGVIPVRFRNRRREVQDRLLGKSPKDSVSVRPIVIRGEVGHEHAKTVSGYLDNEMEVRPNWNAADFVQRMIDWDADCEDPNGTVPVLLCDEIISLLVMRHMADKKIWNHYTLAFPLTTKVNIRRFDNRRETPEYRLGLAIDRERGDLKDYLRESLQFYLLTDPEYLAGLYAALFTDLMAYVQDAITGRPLSSPHNPAEVLTANYRLARNFARYALRLDRESIKEYRDQFLPWQNILRRAYEIVCQEQASDRLQIRRLLEHILRERLGTDFNKGEISRAWQLIERPLQEEFDVDLHLADHKPKSLEGLVSAVQTALLASATSAAQFDISVIEAEPEHRPAVRKLLHEFAEETKSAPLLPKTNLRL